MATIRVQKSLFDLDSFEEVTLVKEGDFTAPTSVQDALHRLGGDSGKLIAVIADGMKAEEMRKLRSTGDGWSTFKKDESGEDTTEINGAFTGKVADSKKVNTLVLTLAKSVFGFGKDMTKEQKKAAKDSAVDMIKNSPPIREGLAKTAALNEDED